MNNNVTHKKCQTSTKEYSQKSKISTSTNKIHTKSSLSTQTSKQIAPQTQPWQIQTRISFHSKIKTNKKKVDITQSRKRLTNQAVEKPKKSTKSQKNKKIKGICRSDLNKVVPALQDVGGSFWRSLSSFKIRFDAITYKIFKSKSSQSFSLLSLSLSLTHTHTYIKLQRHRERLRHTRDPPGQ
jgi:hypothetical protein